MKKHEKLDAIRNLWWVRWVPEDGPAHLAAGSGARGAGAGGVIDLKTGSGERAPGDRGAGGRGTSGRLPWGSLGGGAKEEGVAPRNISASTPLANFF